MHKFSLDELQLKAQTLAQQVQPPYTITLYGGLGAGKTTFSRFFLESLIGEGADVPSPTFNIIQTYDTPKGSVWHADLYRLKTLEEVEETGLIEAMYNYICIIEWPQLIEPLLCDIKHQRIDL